MLAEIHHKIAQDGRNLSERLEDKLTGDFFGAIRYLPFESGLKYVLQTGTFSKEAVQEKWQQWIEKEKGYNMEVDFWHREEEGEIDLLLMNEQVTIGIEVKYLSWLSSEDSEEENDLDYHESINQLARYSKMLERISHGRDAYLLFFAPYEKMNTVRKGMEPRSIIAPSVELGYMCWEDIHESLQHVDLQQFDKGKQFIIEDLLALLSRKDLIRYKGFPVCLLEQPITKGAYHFEGSHEDLHLNWSTTNIQEDDYYVYNPTN